MTISIDRLRAELESRKRKNPRYSLRAFARALGMSQSLLSNILNGKRALTAKQALKIANALSFDALETEKFLGVTFAKKTQNHFPEADIPFDLHWSEVAIMDMIALKDFRADAAWIAEKLNVTQNRAFHSLKRLEKLGLIRRTDGTVQKTSAKLCFTSPKVQKFVRQYHREMAEKALTAMERTDDRSFTAHEFRGATLSVDPSRLPQAKELIKTFLEQLSGLLADGDCTDLYQINIQLFSLLHSK